MVLAAVRRAMVGKGSHQSGETGPKEEGKQKGNRSAAGRLC